MTTVIVVGGGVAGMSTAHELAERGFPVRVFERRSLPGGKARSVAKPGTGTDGRPDLPGEHGFRFFPRFYRHVTDTMKRIPVGEGRHAYENLVQASRDEIARAGRTPIVMPAWFPRSVKDIELLIHDDNAGHGLGLSEVDIRDFAARVWQLITSSRERAVQEYERIPWFTYLGSSKRSEAFRDILARGLTRSLVAATPKEASTEVGGTVLTELIFATGRPGMSDDRLLCGPTNDVWLTPWLAHLRSMGVDYHLNAEVVGIDCVGGRIAGVTVKEGGTTFSVTGDYYVAAVPVERMARLLTEAMVAADPILAGIRTLAGDVAWMTGIQFYLDREIDIVRGHVTYIETPWALTSISQAQFWPGYRLADYGDGTVRDILSVDISDWDTPGILVHRPVVACNDEPDPGNVAASPEPRPLPARCCTQRQIADDVWAQIKRCVNVDGREVLTDEMLRGWYLDRDIEAVGDRLEDAEPLLVNRAGRWAIRPTADTGIPNLFLASDYIRTNTNLATMEAANEAARRAVNGIIDATGADVPECQVWSLYEPWLLAPLRWHDARRYARGLPWDPRPPRILAWLHAAWAVGASLIRRVTPRRGA